MSRKNKYVPTENEVNELVKLYDIDKTDAMELLSITGSNMESIQGYFKSLRHSLIHHYSKKCLRCGRSLKSFQSRLDGYGSSCKKLMEKDLKIKKIRLVEVENVKQRTTAVGN